MFRSINPATEEVLAEHPPLSAADVARRLETAEAAWPAWRQTPLAERSAQLAAAARLLRSDLERHARLITAEMGKTLREARAEVEKCAWGCEFYAEHAAEFLAPREVATDAARSLVRYDPLGAVLAIMPWNFPYWQVFRCAAPALVAGNVVLLKHAANVPGAALAIEEVFRTAGFPDGAFAALLIRSADVEQVIRHPAVQAVSLTGSEHAGAAVAAAAGQQLKKCVLELGGSDPFIVLADADVEAVTAAAVRARCQNAGQSCIAAKRFIVEAPLAERFAERLAERMNALRVGDPRDDATEMGPLARGDLRTALQDQVDRSVAAGARLVAGGQSLPGRGYFYAPTVLVDVRPGMAAFDEETFGPLAAVTAARDLDEVLALANRSPYGLGASLWSAHAERAAELVGQVQAGSVFVNGVVKSDPRLPFGGVKRSGFGRELADVGLREFVNVKTVWVG